MFSRAAHGVDHHQQPAARVAERLEPILVSTTVLGIVAPDPAVVIEDFGRFIERDAIVFQRIADRLVIVP